MRRPSPAAPPKEPPLEGPGCPPVDPVYLRWENTVPPHRKFYEVEIELSLFYPKRLTRRWGRIGTRHVRCLTRVLTQPEQVQRELSLLSHQRRRHGYQLVQQLP
jgi:predicted DNA-binding WGR domain protein